MTAMAAAVVQQLTSGTDMAIVLRFTTWRALRKQIKQKDKYWRAADLAPLYFVPAHRKFSYVSLS